MKIACVLTTINVPRVLALYAKHGPDVMFFVVGDRKTPDMEVVDFLTGHVPNHAYYGIDTQHRLGYKCSRLIGENCIQRRNIGFLEALKWGADIVVSIDDDNILLDSGSLLHDGTYFRQIENRLGDSYSALRVVNAQLHSFAYPPFSGLKASSPSGWFDVGALLQPKAEHRGFPHTKRAQPSFESVVDAKVGVAAGICLGDPDIGAVERIANGPTVHGVSEILRSGVVTDPRETWTVFNSQNTAVIRELAPAWFMFPGIGRYDDIFASLVVQRVMRETSHHVHFGRPFVWQQRNSHDLVKDLTLEIMGMQQIERFVGHLNTVAVPSNAATVDYTRAILNTLDARRCLPFEAIEAALAWCDDCEKVLG